MIPFNTIKQFWITFFELDKLNNAEVINMAKNPKQSSAGTNAREVRKQNQQAAQGQYGTEFASETNAQEVKKRNQQSEQNKK